MPIRVIVNGAGGKMGKLACEVIKKQSNLELVASLSRRDDLGVAIVNHEADVVLDLTRADSVYTNSLTIIEAGAHPIIGTSGLTEQQIKNLQTLCEKEELGGIIAPNFSLGAILMMHLSAVAARFLSEVEIIETHNPLKYDAPSATAIKTAAMIEKNKHLSSSEQNQEGESRGAIYHGVPIHSLRLTGVVARQSVVFGNIGETLTITHDNIDRMACMPGILLCCQKVLELKHLEYGMERLLGLSL